MTPYEIRQDPSGFVRVILCGYWSLDVVREFNDALDALIARNQAESTGAEPLKLLVDAREQNILPREVVEALHGRAGPRGGGGLRMAILVSTMLRKLQAERVRTFANRAIFFEESEAREWLLGGE